MKDNTKLKAEIKRKIARLIAMAKQDQFEPDDWQGLQKAKKSLIESILKLEQQP